MKTIHMLLAAASLATLSACGGQGDDTAGDAVADTAEQQADQLEQQADSAEAAGNEAAADNLEQQADAVEDRGEQMEEAIDDSDANFTGANAAAGTTTTAQ